MNVNNVLIYRPCERLENILKVNILVFGEVRVAHLFSFLCCVFCFVCLCLVACVPNVASVSGLFIFVILPSVFCNVYLLYFFQLWRNVKCLYAFQISRCNCWKYSLKCTDFTLRPRLSQYIFLEDSN